MAVRDRFRPPTEGSLASNVPKQGYCTRTVERFRGVLKGLGMSMDVYTDADSYEGKRFRFCERYGGNGDWMMEGNG